eukprot:m.258605 g.258605  ORF g.258605 m.258605 type:complete len:85 (+) comp40414_c0_seq20:1946-2200(+)
MALAEEALRRDQRNSPDDEFWEADTVRSYGPMLSGLSRSAIRSLPSESFTDVVNAFSEINDLNEGQIVTIWENFKRLHGIKHLP